MYSTVRRIVALVLLVITGLIAPGFVAEAAAVPGPAACTISWDEGAGTTKWAEPANWTEDRLPDPTDAVCIAAAAAPHGVEVAGAAWVSIASLQATAEVSVTVGGGYGMQVMERATLNSLLLIDGGRFESNGVIAVESLDAVAQGYFVVNGSARVERVTLLDSTVDFGVHGDLVASSWEQMGGKVIGGGLHVTGDAAIESVEIGGWRGAGEHIAVDGRLWVFGETRLDHRSLVAHDLVFTSSANERPGPVPCVWCRFVGTSFVKVPHLILDDSELDVTGELRSSRTAAVTLAEDRDPSMIRVQSLVVESHGTQPESPDTLTIGVPWKVEFSHQANVAVGARLVVGDVTTDSANFDVDGELIVGSEDPPEDVAPVTSDQTIRLNRDLHLGTGAILTIKRNAELALQGGDVTGAVGAVGTIVNHGMVTGTGWLTGTVVNEGTLAPRPTMFVEGSFEQGPDATLATYVEGSPLFASHLEIDGTASLDGALRIISTSPVAPSVPLPVLTATGGTTGAFSFVGGVTWCAAAVNGPEGVQLVPVGCPTVAVGQGVERSRAIDFIVNLDKPTTRPLSLQYSVEHGTTGPSDLDLATGNVTIEAGQSTATIVIPILDDDASEAPETFILVVEAAGGPVRATGTIVDDDEALPEFGVQQIIKVAPTRELTGIGTAYVVGIDTVDAGETSAAGWRYRIQPAGFDVAQRGFQPYAINQHDVAIGVCGYTTACARRQGVDTMLDSGSAVGRPGTRAISDSGQIVGEATVGSRRVAVRWPTAAAPMEVLAGLPGSTADAAVAVNAAGIIVGTSKFGSTTKVWVRSADGTVSEISGLPALPLVRIAGISADGTVVGTMSPLDSSGRNIAFTWTRALGVHTLGRNTVVSGINARGDLVGAVGTQMPGFVAYRATLWRDNRVFDLNKALPPGFGSSTLWSADLINDQGVIVATSASDQTFVLVPPGAGCRLCLDGALLVAEYPNPTPTAPAADTIVDGTPASLTALVTNRDTVARTVTVTMVGRGGVPIDEPSSLAIAPAAIGVFETPWDTSGAAWVGAQQPAPYELAIVLRDEQGNELASLPFTVAVVPRPLVTVHGAYEVASTWNTYESLTANAHDGWNVFPVTTIDASDSPSNTVARNAARLAAHIVEIQTTHNAWQVDVVAHELGGLISRYYVDRLMRTKGGVPAVSHLLMLGTPNAGTPCAELFDSPAFAEMRPDLVRQFNATIRERHGVEFAAIAGDVTTESCGTPTPNDQFVPVASALAGVADFETYSIAAGQMTGSSDLFVGFVLPRLNGTTVLPLPLAGASPLLGGLNAAAAIGPTDQSQLLRSGIVSLAPGGEASASIAVEAGLDRLGATVMTDAPVEVRLEFDGAVVVGSGIPTGGQRFRNASTESPTAGSWRVRIINHGTETIDVSRSVWVKGPATELHASAAQVGINGDIRVTAAFSGAAFTPDGPLFASARDSDGQRWTTNLVDDGTGDDAVAADGIYTGRVGGPVPGPVVVTVDTDDITLRRMVTTAVVVQVGADGPGNDAPIAMGADVVIAAGASARVDLEAADPEGSPITFEIVGQPAHGRLGGAGPRFDYLPNAGYHGRDSFTYRVSDGERWSDPAVVTVTVGRAPTEIVLRRPVERAAVVGPPMNVEVSVAGPGLEPVDGGIATFHFGTHTVTAEVSRGTLNGSVASAIVPVDVAPGRHDLVIEFSGNENYASSTLTESILVAAGNPPVPALQDVVGEAGYTTRLSGFANDPDGDATRYQFDFTDDGIFDAELGPRESRLTFVDHVYPAAFNGQARLRVTDNAGQTADAVAAVVIAPHRDLGALRRILVDGAPVKVLDVSDDGRHVLYQVVDNEDGQALPTPVGVLDRHTGVHEIVSIRPDGQVEDFPDHATISPDGSAVAFSSSATVNGFTSQQVYVRNMATATTTVASVADNGDLADRGGAPVAVTNDGGAVLFTSLSGNLTGTDVEQCGSAGRTTEPCQQLYIRDLGAHTTRLVSESLGGVVADVVDWPGMSADGRFVTYGSRGQLWFVDLVGDTRERLTPGIGGTDGNKPGTGYHAAVSGRGRFATFASDATNLVAGDDNDAVDLFRFDRLTGDTVMLTSAKGRAVGTGGQPGGTGSATDNAAARTVFVSESPNLVGGDSNGVGDIFVRDLAMNATIRASVEARETVQADQASHIAIVSGNGRFVFFRSDATNLVPGDVEGLPDSFVLDLGTETTEPSEPVNHTPAAADVTATSPEDTGVSVTLAGSDADDDALTYVVVAPPSHGILSGTGAALTYSPEANWSGTDTFMYTAADATETSSPATVAVVIVAVNDAPTVTVTAPAAVVVGSPVTATATTTDIDGDTVSCSIEWGDGTAVSPGCSNTHRWTAAGTYTVTVAAADVAGASATATHTVTVTAPPPPPVCAFQGFFAPVQNRPAVNTVKAGSTIPLKFTFCTDGRLAIFAPGYPASIPHACGVTAAGPLESTVGPGASPLSFDTATSSYHYNWQSSRAWAGTCRTLIMKFLDGSQAAAELKFK